jgi:hypothetical protein
MTAEKDAAQKSLMKKYGLSPLESILQKRKRWEDAYNEQMARSSRHRNVHKIKEAEEWILRYNVEALPYTAPKYQAIAVQSEVKQVTMAIRAPEPISDSKAWLEQYAPKHTQQSATPVLDHFRDALQKSYDTATALGIDDAGAIPKEAKR